MSKAVFANFTVDSNQMRSKNPVVIVTGCSSGIGFELAKLLYKNPDYNAVITCRERSMSALQAVFSDNERFMVRELDVTKDENIYSLIHEIQDLWGRVDVVVNNAAVCYRAVVEHMDFESEQIQLRTNYLGPMSLIRSVLPLMREQRSGHIINISSVSGMLAMPTMGSYSASKHALEGATEALWYEAKPVGIKVNLLQLGFINSDAVKNVVLAPKARMSTQLSGPHSEYYKSMVPMIETLMKYSFNSSATIAEKIMAIIRRPKSHLRVPLTIDAVFFGILKKIIPSLILQRILYMMLPNSRGWGGRWSVAKTSPALKKATK